MLLWRVVKYVFYLPFAGIILIRSYGCYLSRPESIPRQHPGKFCHAYVGLLHGPCKDKGTFFFLDVTFLPAARTISIQVFILIETFNN
jgi:hypothetical protein